MEKLKNVKGSYDYGSRDQIIRNYISDTLKEVFEKYGYKSLSTSILCYYDLLALKYNNRKIMTGIIEICKIPKEKIAETITIVDKFEKLTKEEIKLEFIKIGLEEKQIEKLINYLNMNFIEIKDKFEETENMVLQEGITEVYELNKYIQSLNLNEYVQFVATLARGQEYYTGTIFEVYQKNGEIKSSIGGRRKI